MQIHDLSFAVVVIMRIGNGRLGFAAAAGLFDRGSWEAHAVGRRRSRLKQAPCTVPEIQIDLVRRAAARKPVDLDLGQLPFQRTRRYHTFGYSPRHHSAVKLPVLMSRGRSARSAASAVL
jgi:hypothetical protein